MLSKLLRRRWTRYLSFAMMAGAEILLGALVLTLAKILEGFITYPMDLPELTALVRERNFWSFAGSIFLVTAFALFALFANEDRWFGVFRKAICTVVGSLTVVCITLFFGNHTSTGILVAAAIGLPFGYFGEYWAQAL